MGKMRGLPILILSTKGRKSGKVRNTPLMYFEIEEKLVIIASNNGRDKHTSWFHNLKHHPAISININGKKRQVQSLIVTEDEKSRYWDVIVKEAPFYGKYQNKTTRKIPIILIS